MTSNDKSTIWGHALRYGIAALLLLLAVVAVLRGGRWYEAAIMLIPALMFLIGNSRRIYRPAVSRSGMQIICRFIPWFESIIYFGALLAAIGVAGFWMGSDPGYPGWFRYGGVFLVCLCLLFLASFLRSWRLSRLCITPTTLTVRLPLIRPPVSLRGNTEIRREQILSIEPKIVELNLGAKIFKTEVVFRPDGTDDTTTVSLGQQFTVDPMNLLGGAAGVEGRR